MPLLIDSHAICHRMKHTLKDMSYDDMATGVIYGFFTEIRKLIKQFNTKEVIFTWDSKTSKRKVVYPNYKNRAPKDLSPKEKHLNEAAYGQINILREVILPNLGVACSYHAEGYEADDLLASIIENNRNDFIIVSSDNDLYQLLSPTTVIFNIQTKKLYYAANFIADYLLFPPSQWSAIKALAGCKSDTVEGIEGVGEKTAIKYLKDSLKVGSKAYMAIESEIGKEIYKRNLPLVKLPYEGTPKIKLPKEISLSLCLDYFLDVCDKYNFSSFTKKESLKEWKQTLNLS